MAAGDVPEPRVFASIGQAWVNIWPHFWWLLLFGIIAAVAQGSMGNNASVYEQSIPAGVLLDAGGLLLLVFLGGPVGVGLVKVHLAASRGEKPTFQDLGYAFSGRYWQSVLLGVLAGLIVVGGLILFIIPGIYLAVKLSFASIRFIENDLSAKEAIKASFEDVKGRWWPVFGLGLMTIPIVLGGLLALILGVFVAMVWVSQMGVVYWRATVENS